MSVRIRIAAESDHEALVEQFWALNRFEDAISGDRRTDRAAAEASLAAANENIARSGGLRLVAETGGAVIGHLFLMFERDAPFIRDDVRAYAYIAELFVREPHRRRGVGRALMAEAERLAAERGVRRLMVGFVAGNSGAERVYDAFGFRRYAVQMAKPIRGGR